MKIFKRILAASLVLAILMSFAGCHKKNEIAVKVGDVEFTSAYYMCALMSADAEAKNIVYENLSEEEAASGEIDYYSKKVEDKDYVKWVEETAINNLKEIAAYKILCKENKVEVPEEDFTNATTMAEYYWSSYGYSAYFEPNGVGKDTYTKYTTDAYYAESYFEHVYGPKGEKAIASDKVLEKIYENFIIADVLEGNYSSEMTEDDRTALKNTFETYFKDLSEGKRTFEEIYKEYNQITEEEETTEETDEAKPKDEYASILGAEDTVYESIHYEKVKAMKQGEVKLIPLDNEAGYALVVKQDIKADDYYKDNLDMIARHLIADEEMEKTIKDYIKKLDVEISKYAIGQFKVKEIKEPEYA